MTNVLVQIKRLVLRRQIIWTAQSESQMAIDDLTRDEVIESIVNARSVRSKRSTSHHRRSRSEKVYIISGRTFGGLMIYTKGVIRHDEAADKFYVMISAKRSERLS